MTKSLAQLKACAYRVPQGTKQITLRCGHVALYVRPLPPVGELAFCRECNTTVPQVRYDENGGVSCWDVDCVLSAATCVATGAAPGRVPRSAGAPGTSVAVRSVPGERRT